MRANTDAPVLLNLPDTLTVVDGVCHTWSDAQDRAILAFAVQNALWSPLDSDPFSERSTGDPTLLFDVLTTSAQFAEQGMDAFSLYIRFRKLVYMFEKKRRK